MIILLLTRRRYQGLANTVQRSVVVKGVSLVMVHGHRCIDLLRVPEHILSTGGVQWYVVVYTQESNGRIFE